MPINQRPIPAMHILTVETAEHGLKLIAFLARRLDGGAGTAELHRWIRTGQVRVNGKRAKAFDRVESGDAVRLPPFAANDARHHSRDVAVAHGDILGAASGGSLRVVVAAPDFLALEKPSGLPSQPGTGQETSVSAILREHFAGAAYIPAPAHRLDKATSGILLAGRTHDAQEKLHALFARQTGDAVEKAYLAWVLGAWPHADEQIFTDYLLKKNGPEPRANPKTAKGFPRPASHGVFETVQAAGPGEGREAVSRVALLETRETPLGTASLLRVVLETGRTHQIRAQLSIRNFPIIGDLKYGGKPFSRMLLHAYSLAFNWEGGPVAVCVPPVWPRPFTVALPSGVA